MGYPVLEKRVWGDSTMEEEVRNVYAVREAVGDDFTLMADPVAAYTLEEAVRFGRELERLGYLWLEEPLLSAGF